MVTFLGRLQEARSALVGCLVDPVDQARSSSWEAKPLLGCTLVHWTVALPRGWRDLREDWDSDRA
jgi:hypothetical protein